MPVKQKIVSTRGPSVSETHEAKKLFLGEYLEKIPLAVLINRGSASASEIVAASLKDHKRALIMGTQSFGKGSVQTIMPFQVANSDNLTGIRLTTARYYTPSGASIQGKGITPDIIVEQGEFESYDFKTFSESDLKDSLDKSEDSLSNDDENTELSDKEKRLAKDYQLQRALDLLKGLSLFEESFEE